MSEIIQKKDLYQLQNKLSIGSFTSSEKKTRWKQIDESKQMLTFSQDDETADL